MADHLFGITDTGKVRKNNEDVFIAEELMNGQFILAGVIDGVGAYEGGEVAAAVTKEVIVAELGEIGSEVITQLIVAFNLANEEIIGKKLLDKQLADMACVATVAVINKQNNMLYYIHVGDTRLYLFRDKSLVKISHDQSFVGFLEESGRLTEAAAMQHPKRNEINQALGLGSREEMTETYFETGSSPFLPGDMILICSDGLTDLVTGAEIAAVLTAPGTLQTKGAELIKRANAAGGKDNITVVLAINDKSPVQHEILRPAETKPAIPVTLPPVTSVKSTNSAAEVKAVEDDGKVKVNKFLLIFLTVFCVLLAGTSIWLSLSYFLSAHKEIPVAATAAPVISLQEKQLRDSIARFKGDTLLLSDEVFKSPVRLTKALNIDRDSLVIRTKGNVVLLRDSAYGGPALLLSPRCKYVVVDNLVIEGFETGVAYSQNALELKNVKFIKCKHPVQVFLEFPDGYFVNGRLNKRNVQADSLAKK